MFDIMFDLQVIAGEASGAFLIAALEEDPALDIDDADVFAFQAADTLGRQVDDALHL